MHKAQEQVEAFHRAIEQTVGVSPAIRDAELRASLVFEEAFETVAAIIGMKRAQEMLRAKADEVRCVTAEPDLVEAVDGMCDTLVVVYGTAVAFGVDLEPFFDEVNRTNMAKVSGPVRADGKRLKPPGWKPPRIREMLEEIVAKKTGGA